MSVGIVGRIAFCLIVSASVAGCVGPRRVAGENAIGYVGPVALEVLARLLVDNADVTVGSVLPVGQPPFLLAVSPVRRPQQRSTLTCEWRDGKWRSFAFLPTEKSATQRHADSDLTPVPPGADLDRVEQVVRVNQEWTLSPSSVEDILPRSARDTYHVAYLCSQGQRVAIAVGYVHDALAGFGSVVVLERAEQEWVFVEAVKLWGS